MTPPPHTPSEEEKKLYSEFLAEVNKRETASSDNFDKSVLTLSSAGLGLSVSFLKDIGGTVSWPWVLYGSWMLFVAATLSTMASFLVSAKALDAHKTLARKAYIEGDEKAFAAKNPWDICTRWLNYISAATFGMALIATIVFVITNVKEGDMASSTPKASASNGEHVTKGLTVPTMQRPVATPAPAASAPAPAPAASAPAPAASASAPAPTSSGNSSPTR